MGAQVTATALLAEMRASAGAASVQSLSTNGANQDVVSMGTIAARLLRQRLDLTRQIHAILALALAQAMDLRATGPIPTGPDHTGPGVDVHLTPADAAGGAPFDVQGLAPPGSTSASGADILGRAGFSASAREIHALVRQVSPPLERDRPLGPEITALAEALRGDPVAVRWRVQAA